METILKKTVLKAGVQLSGRALAKYMQGPGLISSTAKKKKKGLFSSTPNITV
jgi:hypothetical protein